jgi:adenosylcobinamide kinase/adenosylcobinamide-phosphate guanylyltransferase
LSITFILGGARSGKSRFAESLAHGRCHYVATAQALDAEMHSRVAAHRDRRGAGWTTHEEAIDLSLLLPSLDQPGNFILVDCLTLWLSNLLHAEVDWREAAETLCSTLRHMKSDVALVSNEVGMGIVPVMQLGREFRDAQGLLNQQVAAAADTVVFVAAGLPLILKGQLP